jgi:3-oxoacyl-(acyl-carrier-protein) synthase
VVITGMGALTAAGRGVGPFWQACVAGRPALSPVSRFDVSDLGPVLAGEVGEALLPDEERASAFALIAAAEALAATGLSPDDLPPASGVVLGTCLGDSIASSPAPVGPEVRAPHELAIPSPHERAVPSPDGLAAPAWRIAAACGLSGPVSTVSVACASGTAAIASAASCIRRGEADLMLAGGTDALSRFVISGFWLLRALSPTRVRPFDRRRDGLALGEGAGLVVLEERGRALKRGAPILAEIGGGGSAADACHMTGPSPDGEGVLRAMSAALAEARQAPENVGFISAHGTGTVFNDRMETRAFKRLLGPGARRVPIDSIKPVIGHTLGAAGALEAILCVKVMQDGIVPPTINLDDPDPECDLDYVPGEARRVEVRSALSTSSAFAGHNAALLLEAP